MQCWGKNKKIFFHHSAFIRNAVVRLTSLVYFPSLPSDIDQASRTQQASMSLDCLVPRGKPETWMQH